MSVLLETSFGDIVIDLYIKKAPLACINFLKLCKIKHYNNALFAEVQKSIIINILDYVTKVKPNHPTNIWRETGSN
jgi:peptidyl-prolyl cis-trans isomerase-like 4